MLACAGPGPNQYHRDYSRRRRHARLVDILADGFVADGPSALKSASPGKQFHIRVVAHAAQTSTLDEWKAQVGAVGRLTEDGAAAMRATAKWRADLPRDGRRKAVACHRSRCGRISRCRRAQPRSG